MKSRMAGFVFALAVMPAFVSGGDTVPESPRELPCLADVDVVVVGGTVAGVQAAVSARAAGASVFLAAPRFQLGEELTTTRSLWLDAADEATDDPFVAAMFAADRRTPYTYSYDTTPNAGHSDANLSRLRDGVAGSAATESVQFDGLVTITAVLGMDPGAFRMLRLKSFRREASGGFVTGSVTVTGSVDGDVWTPVEGSADIVNQALAGQSDTLDVLTFTATETSAPTHLRIVCACAEGYGRQLLGELEIVTANAGPTPVRPLVIAQQLDRALLDAGVPFLTGAPVTDLLRDGAGRAAGVAVANRNGRQAIRAKVVVDATELAAAARGAGVAFRSDAPSTRFTRTVLCRKGDLDALAADSVWQVVECIPPRVNISADAEDLRGDGAPSNFDLGAYRVSRDFVFETFSYAAWMQIERAVRDATWVPSVADVSEKCAFTPPDRITGRASIDVWPGAAALALDTLRSAETDGLWVLGPCADLSRTAAGKLRLPGVETVVGRRVGAAAAAEAVAVSRTGAVGLGAAPGSGSAQVHERLSRPLNVGTEDGTAVSSAGADLPVLADVDVLVVGGGTAGVPAARAAAGTGRTVLLAEVLYELGGVAVDNRIGRYWRGNVRGYAADSRAEVKRHGWIFHAASADWQRRVCGTNGVDVWLGAFAEGVVTDGGDGAGRARVTGVVLVLPDGTRGVVRATATVDATGNADLTAAAGGATTFLDNPEFAAQGVGASNIQLGRSYLNTDVGFLDDTDAGDMSHFLLRSRLVLTESWFQPVFPSSGSRERRRIVGDVTVTELDVLRGRTWPDTVMHGHSNFDMHGFSTSPVLMLYEHPSGEIDADVPFRALLPQGLEGLLATGLGISATRDAMPIIRMQPDVQNQGWAAGLAASAACAQGGSLRAIDVAALQRALVEGGMLEARVTQDADGAAVTESELDAAIAGLDVDYHGLESILAAPSDVALPKLRTAFTTAPDRNHRVALGVALALLGDSMSVEYLLGRYGNAGWDAGREYTGMGNFGRQTSVLDGVVYALAQTRDPRVLPLLGALGETLAADGASVAELSHFRAFAHAVRSLPAAALMPPLLAAIARAPEALTGHAMTEVAPCSYSEGVSDGERTGVIRELLLGETLMRGGDPDGSGRLMLESYAADPRASYAVWARRVLASAPYTPQTDRDGVWTSTAVSGDWSEALNWRDGLVAEGPTATAAFSELGDGTRQTVAFPQDGLQIGSLLFTDGGVRVFTGGPLSFLSPSAVLGLSAGSITFGNGVSATALEKNGPGTARFAGALDVSRKLALNEGTVRLDNGVAATEIAETSFTVSGDDDVWITHLGCPASAVAALDAGRIRIRLKDADGKTVEAVLFTARHRGFARGANRFLRLASPRRLAAGSYRLESSSGTAAIALRAAKSPEQKLRDVDVAGRLELASSFVTAASLSGTGVVAVVSDRPVDLTLDASSSDSVFDGRLLEETPEGAPLSVTKLGAKRTTLHGVAGIRDGVSPRDGTLVLDSPAALDPDATIVFGGRTGDIPRGNLAFEAVDAVVSNPVVCTRMPTYNIMNNGFRALGGQNLTVRDMQVTAGDSVCDTADKGGEGILSFIADYTESEPTCVTVENVELPYIDVSAQLFGQSKKTRGANRCVFRSVTAPDGLRKLQVLNTTSNSVGGVLAVLDSSLDVDWLDLTGPYVGFNLSTGSTIRATNVRCPSSNGVQHSSPEVLIDGGARLVCSGFPNAGSMYRTTNAVFRFDGAVFQLLNDHVASFFPLAPSNPPVEVLPGGVTFDLETDSRPGTFRSLRILHPMTSPVAGVPGPLTVVGGDPAEPDLFIGEVKFSAPMSYNGPIVLKGGSLVFDFTHANAAELETMLSTTSDLVFAGGALSLLSNEPGRHQSFAVLSNASDRTANVTVASGCRIDAVALRGRGGYAFTGGEVGLTLDPLAGSCLLEGRVALDGATLRVSADQVSVAPAQVRDGSFEPKNPFPEPASSPSNTGSLDKRGARDASWFETNLPGWTFDADDNVGVCRDGSYFNASTTASDGLVCLFLRRTSGTVSHLFRVDRTARYTLVFDYKSRDWSGTAYHAKVDVACDGDHVQTTEDITDARTWHTVTVDLGTLQPGDHVLSFGSVVASGDALVDNVRLGYEVAAGQTELDRIVSPELELDLRNGAKLDLDFTGRLSVAKIRIDDVRRCGTFSAAVTPDLVTGGGSVFCNPSSTLFIFR